MQLANVSYCGCRPGEGICGPFGQGPVTSQRSYGGDPSLFLAKKVDGETEWTDAALLNGGRPCVFVGAKSSRCLPPVCHHILLSSSAPQHPVHSRYDCSYVIFF